MASLAHTSISDAVIQRPERPADCVSYSLLVHYFNQGSLTPGKEHAMPIEWESWWAVQSVWNVLESRKISSVTVNRTPVPMLCDPYRGRYTELSVPGSRFQGVK